MEAKPLAVGKILSERQRFVVPIYQRTYAWTVKEQLEPFFDQLEEKAQERMASGKVTFSHYMGALLVIPISDPVFGRIQPFSVVDGQQRLTTFCLLFAALRDVARELETAVTERQLTDLLVYPDDTPMDDKANEKYKLQPTRYDRVLFRDLIDKPSAEIRSKYGKYYYKNGKLRVGEAPLPLVAYHYFRDSALDFIGRLATDVDETEQHKKLIALSTTIFESFKLIVITLAKDDDAQVIFETLNRGGKPLAAMDLVRNDVFYRAIQREENTEILMDEHWQVFEEPFWKQDQVQGRLRKPRIDFYLGHVLASELGRVVSLGELFAEYKNFSTSRPLGSSSEELKRITKHVNTYRQLLKPEEPSMLSRLGHRLSVFDVSTATPLVFAIDGSDLPDDDKRALFELIGSYIIRREICGLTAKNYNYVFAELAGAIKVNRVSVEAFRAAFVAKAQSVAAKFPSDAELETAILSRSVYSWMQARRLRLILEELEVASRSKFEVNAPIPPGLAIEHVMPQSWFEHWPLQNGAKVAAASVLDDQTQQMVTRRNSVIHTLGNLTLLTPPANASMSNLPLRDKKARLQKSLLFMNLAIAEVQDDEWTEDKGIAARGLRLAKLAKSLWPGLM